MLMIKSFEPVYKELEELFIQKLPEYIEKINKEYNDGINLKKFENHNLIEECSKLPCFKFSLEESEYTEKDRIIENTVFNMRFEIKITDYQKDKIIIYWRYFETIQEMLKDYLYDENSIFLSIKFMHLNTNSIQIKIIT